MAARPDVGAVVHTHSPAACQFAALDVPLRPLDHAGLAVLLSRHSPLHPDRRPDQGPVARPGAGGGARRRGRDPATAARHRHGRPRPARGVMTAVLLDRACRTQLARDGGGTAAGLGSPRMTPWPSARTSGRRSSCERATSTCSARRPSPPRRPASTRGRAHRTSGRSAARSLSGWRSKPPPVPR